MKKTGEWNNFPDKVIIDTVILLKKNDYIYLWRMVSLEYVEIITLTITAH